MFWATGINCAMANTFYEYTQISTIYYLVDACIYFQIHVINNKVVVVIYFQIHVINHKGVVMHLGLNPQPFS